ncbi:hypothetical protein RQP46_008590 [Phenoliferia psychrophenolica]
MNPASPINTIADSSEGMMEADGVGVQLEEEARNGDHEMAVVDLEDEEQDHHGNAHPYDYRDDSSELSSIGELTATEEGEEAHGGDPEQEREPVEEGEVMRTSSDPAVVQGLSELDHRREEILSDQGRRSNPSKQDASGAALWRSMSKRSQKAFKPTMRAYRQFCEEEDVDPFPIVADVVAIFLSDYAFNRRHAGFMISIFEQGRKAMFSLWKRTSGVARLEDDLASSPACTLITQSDPMQDEVASSIPHCLPKPRLDGPRGTRGNPNGPKPPPRPTRSNTVVSSDVLKLDPRPKPVACARIPDMPRDGDRSCMATAYRTQQPTSWTGNKGTLA